MAIETKLNTTLIIGGTSGLGLALATLLNTKKNFEIYITGRKKPDDQQMKFIYLDIDQYSDQLPATIDNVISCLPRIDLLVYSAGFYQEDTIKHLADSEIRRMMNVGLFAPTLILNRVLNQQEGLSGFIAITSTSQWTPRICEPIYTAVKAGLGMFANSLSLDPQIGKVLVVGPAGMRTNFWAHTEKDTSAMLESSWVAKQIHHLYSEGNFQYKCAKILREPPRIEIVETR